MANCLFCRDKGWCIVSNPLGGVARTKCHHLPSCAQARKPKRPRNDAFMSRKRRMES